MRHLQCKWQFNGFNVMHEIMFYWMWFVVSYWDVFAVDFDESRPWQQRFISNSVRLFVFIFTQYCVCNKVNNNVLFIVSCMCKLCMLLCCNYVVCIHYVIRSRTQCLKNCPFVIYRVWHMSADLVVFGKCYNVTWLR